jgi:2-C-methyl-D-erythritol 4-phosphate cytidylyltransferase
MLEWSIEALNASPSIEQVVVALPPGVDAPAGTTGALGGEHRSLSVRNALALAEGDAVVVCDAARPLLTPALVEAVLAGLAGVDAAIAAAPVTDTVKEARDGQVIRTLDRAGLWAVQTPQAFRRDALERALAQPDEVLAAATDDASLVEALGGTVRIVEAPRENLKVTTPMDFQLAELLLRERS